MDTVEITLSVPELEHERYIAILDDRATGFIQNDAELTAYIPADEWSVTDREALRARLAADGYEAALTVQHLEDRNWNAVWEDSVAPVRVGPVLLCGTSTKVPPEHADAEILRIDPKMSFGTGHHATTRLALRVLIERLQSGDRVLDVGTGTGVLAVAACRLGARSVEALDTDAGAVTNARQNVAQNDVASCVTVREGTIDAATTDAADIIVANITRDVLVDLLPTARSRLTTRGTLILSGLLISDQSQMTDALTQAGFRIVSDARENGWWAVRATPTSESA